MNKGKRLSKHPSHISNIGAVGILKFASVVGSNAAGKSNFVSAMQFAAFSATKRIPADCVNDYCRIIPDNKNKPSSFEFEIKIGSKYYAYGFDILLNQMKFTGEWLYEISPKKGDELLFKRQPLSGDYDLGKRFNDADADRLRIYAEDMKNEVSSSFLKELNTFKGDLFEKFPSLKPIQDIYLWFTNQLRLSYPGEPLSVTPALIDDKNIEMVNSILSSLGLGIKGCKPVVVPREELNKLIRPEFLDKIIADIIQKESKLKKDGANDFVGGGTLFGGGKYFTLKIDPDSHELVVKKLQFQHAENDVWFDYEEESDGTKRMIQLLDLLFAAVTKSSNVFVIDEIDRSLHPNLTRKLIETFLSLAEDVDIQLIVTTHEIEILTLDLLRRDEIWFVEKDGRGASVLSSLDQYKERFDKRVGRAYLEGRYGATPVFEPFPAYIQGRI